MHGGQRGRASAPEIALRQLSVVRYGSIDCWSIGWNITNKGAGPLVLVAARLPHSQFKSNEHRFEPTLKLASGQSGQFEVCVICSEPAGLVTENAFVIFSVIWAGEAWRIFVRIRVTVNAEGKPETETEMITTQKTGFSGVTG
jgi:hypothetical protein